MYESYVAPSSWWIFHSVFNLSSVWSMFVFPKRRCGPYMKATWHLAHHNILHAGVVSRSTSSSSIYCPPIRPGVYLLLT
jgi:hypothetical protein